MEDFVFGIEGLDTLLRGALARGTLLVVAGHPGAGKTTFASTICYRNALRGSKCLYISVQEDRGKLYRNMKRLGIDFEEIEKKGLLKYIKLPLAVSEEAVPNIYIDTVNKGVLEFSPSIIVVDSIAPILKAIGSDARARAVLSNFFFELPKLINGLVILIAEMPLTEERIEPGDIEFVADTILILRHSVVGRLLYREIEIRKARGAPLSVARVFFTIREGEGVKAYVPPRLTEIPPPNIDAAVKPPCKGLEGVLGPLYMGEIIYVSYPPHLFPANPLLLMIAAAVVNKGRLLIISYDSSPEYIWHQITELVKGYLGTGVSIDKVKEILRDYVVVEAYSPASYTPEELFYLAMEGAERVKPHAIAILGSTIGLVGEGSIKRFGDLLFNLMLYFRKMGTLIIVFSSHQKELHEIYSHIADTIIRTRAYRRGDGEELRHFIAKKGKPSTTVREEALKPCIEDSVKLLAHLLEQIG